MMVYTQEIRNYILSNSEKGSTCECIARGLSCSKETAHNLLEAFVHGSGEEYLKFIHNRCVVYKRSQIDDRYP